MVMPVSLATRTKAKTAAPEKAIAQHKSEVADTSSNTDSFDSHVFTAMPIIQPKLKIGDPNDKYEQEADRVADEVMRMPDSEVMGVTGTEPPAQPLRTPVIQRMCSACQKEESLLQMQTDDEEDILQKKPSVGASANHSLTLQTGINHLRRNRGNALPTSAREFMEQRFGHDFSAVNIHTDSAAVALSQQLNARAFTVGQDIFFNQGEFNPTNRTGSQLLAHELTHVVQQQSSSEQIQRQLTAAEELEICTGICACAVLPLSGACFTAGTIAIHSAAGCISTLKPEINYNMTIPNRIPPGPPEPIMSRTNPLCGSAWIPARLYGPGAVTFYGPGGTPVPFVPATGMLRRPDLVAVNSPMVPPVQSNIRAVVEVKFPGDTWRPGQQAAYQQIAGAAPVLERGVEDCPCEELATTAAASLAAFLAFRNRDAINRMMRKLLGRGGSRATGPAYAAATLLAMVTLLSSEDAHASLTLNPFDENSQDPILALIQYLSSNGVGTPEEIQDFIDSRPGLRERLEAAMESEDFDNVSRDLQGDAAAVIADNIDAFTPEELDALLTGAQAAAGERSEAVPTVESLRAALEAQGGVFEEGALVSLGGESDQGGTSPGEGADSTSREARGETTQGTTEGESSTPESESGTTTTTSGDHEAPATTREQLDRLAANEWAEQLWQRLTSETAAQGPEAGEVELEEFLRIAGDITQTEYEQLVRDLTSIPEEADAVEVLERLRSRLAALRNPPPAPEQATPEEEDASQANLVDDLRESLNNYPNWERVSSNSHFIPFGTRSFEADDRVTVILYGRQPGEPGERFVSQVSIRFTSSREYVVEDASSMVFADEGHEESGSSLVGLTGQIRNERNEE